MTAPLLQPVVELDPGRAHGVVGAPAQAGPTADRPAGMCIVLPDIGDGEGAVIARNLRRHGSQRAVVLTRRSATRDLVQLLSGGVRGAVAIDSSGAGTLSPRPAAEQVSEPSSRLTARELSVVSRVAEGMSNRDIGEALGLSALTIKSHLARISRKLGTGDRAAMVAVALRRGLI